MWVGTPPGDRLVPTAAWVPRLLGVPGALRSPETGRGLAAPGVVRGGCLGGTGRHFGAKRFRGVAAATQPRDALAAPAPCSLRAVGAANPVCVSRQ